MRDVRAKNIVSVDTISKGNIKPWIKLIEFMETVPEDEDINFTFESIKVYQPWAAYTFTKLLSDPRVHMTFMNDAESVKTIELMLHLNGYKTGRIVNKDTRTNKKEDKAAALLKEKAKELQPYFHPNDDGSVTFKADEKYDQIGSINTVNYIQAALLMRNELTGEKHIIMDSGNITLFPNILEDVSNMVDVLANVGVMLEIRSQKAEVMNKINLYRGLGENKNDIGQHYSICKARMKENVVGMLAKYKDSKGKDEFGRHGKGEIVTNRIAIFRGFTAVEGGPALTFQVFNGKTFFPREHWYLENDGQILMYNTGRDMTPIERSQYERFTQDGEVHTTKKMEVSTLTIPLEEIGIYNDFLGSKYHFMAPIQKRRKDSRAVFEMSDGGYAHRIELTIPELAKKVLDDYGISYDKGDLEECIKKTQEILKDSVEESTAGSSGVVGRDDYSDYYQ